MSAKRYTVADATQVNIEGVVHDAGATFEADPESPDVQAALASGWVTEAKAGAAPRSRRR